MISANPQYGCRYETSNHLWLILEYCVGGDLMSLLRQDMRLPESSIHDFGRDLVISIQYLHSNAIIYCDLKPSNILLDENGRIKLGGFGLSRRLSDINKTSLQQLPPVRLCHGSSNNCHGSSNNCNGMSRACKPSICGIIGAACVELANTLHVASSSAHSHKSYHRQSTALLTATAESKQNHQRSSRDV